MDRKCLENLRLDRRLIARRKWISPDELRRELERLPDVADKAAPPELDEGESEEEATPSE